MAEPIFMKLGMNITTSKSMSAAYLVSPSHHFVFLYVYPLTVAWKRLRKIVTAASNTHATIEGYLHPSSSMLSVLGSLDDGRMVLKLYNGYLTAAVV
jgi:hypothetical protein